LAFLSGLLASLLCVFAYAQTYKPFPGEPIDQRTRTIQERVDAVYTGGDFVRALLIYEKDLAPLGDKYAQYMVGYMHLEAEGVPQDKVEALAWYRLAAERSEPLLERVRDGLAAQMTAVEMAGSDQRFLDLWKSIGDRTLIMELIRRDMGILRTRTGTRIPGAVPSSPSVTIRVSGEPVGPNYYRKVRTRLENRIAYLDARVEISDIVIAGELEKFRSLEAEMKQQLASMEIP